jgi:hypothetical protein
MIARLQRTVSAPQEKIIIGAELKHEPQFVFCAAGTKASLLLI